MSSIQSHAHLIVRGEKILVLQRTVWGKYNRYRDLKLRKSGTDGDELTDESYFLEERPDILEKLRAGEVIRL